MDYELIDQLTNSAAFQGRVRACCTQEALTFQSDQRADITALANEILRTGGTVFNFVRIIAAAPGVAPEQPNGDGPPGVDQSTIPDAVILAQVQHQWPTVAALFWDADGNRIEPS